MYVKPEIEKKYDLSFKINSQLGFGHLRRNLFNVNPSVVVKNQGSRVTTLQPSENLTLEKLSVLFLTSDQPLSCVGTKEDSSTLNLNIANFLLIDQALTNITITNSGSGAATVKVVWGSK